MSKSKIQNTEVRSQGVKESRSQETNKTLEPLNPRTLEPLNYERQKLEDRSQKSEDKDQKDNTEGKIIVKYKKSCIGYPKGQKLTLKALGLNKLNSEKIHNNNKVIQGMVRKVKHLVEVKEL